MTVSLPLSYLDGTPAFFSLPFASKCYPKLAFFNSLCKELVNNVSLKWYGDENTFPMILKYFKSDINKYVSKTMTRI